MFNFNNINDKTHEPKIVPITRSDKLNFFKTKRREQYETSLQIMGILRLKDCVVVYAEEKSGKRTIVEICAVLDWDEMNVQHIYITSLSRKDTKIQLVELREFRVVSEITYSKTKTRQTIKKLKDILREGKRLVIHLDECDYGSGKNQSLELMLEFCKNENVKLIKYSATPEESLFSCKLLNNNSCEFIRFKPSPDYRGAEWFDKNGFLIEAEEFIDYDELMIANTIKFTEQGIEALNRITSHRNIGVLRLTGSHNKTSIYQKFRLVVDKNPNINYIFINSDNGINWGDEEEIKEKVRHDKANIFVINQCCSRSTEICGYLKSKTAFSHDYRKDKNKKAYNTKSQAYGRFKHYKYDGFTGLEINWGGMIYIDVDVFRANYNPKYFEKIKKLSSRVKTNKQKSIITESELTYSFEDAQQYVRENYSRNYKIPRHMNQDGKYEHTSRSIRKVWTQEEVLNDLGAGIDEDSKFRIRPCYDGEQLIVIVAYYAGKNNNKIFIHKTKNNSIYF